MTNEEKLLNFQTVTMQAARQKSAIIIKEYEDSLNKTFDEHRAEKEKQAELQIKTERTNLARQKNKELSLKQIQLRQEITQKQDELKNKIFDEAKELVKEFMHTPDYSTLLTNQIKKDLEFAHGENITIYIDPVDEYHKAELESVTGTLLTMSDESFIGGTRAVISNRHILIDDSFKTKLEEAYTEFSFKGGSSL